MRWYVEATKVGTHTPPVTLVVDAEAWPRALQAARAIRGESGPIADFTIELLDDGCRAIEPHGLVTYRVTTAPDDTPLGEVRAASRVPPRPSSVKDLAAETAAKGSGPIPAAPSSRSAIVPSAAPSVPSVPAAPAAPAPPALLPGSPVPVAAASAPAVAPSGWAAPAAVPSVPVPRPSAPALAPSAPSVPPAVAVGPIPDSVPSDRGPDDLPRAMVVFQRVQTPTADSPLHYREYAFALPPGTTEEIAERVLFVELANLQKDMGPLPSGKLINLAAFDRVFTGRPSTLPLVTLTWKDWRNEPVLDHPSRRGTPAAPMPLSFPPPSNAAPGASDTSGASAAEVARISSLPSATIPSGPPSSPASAPGSSPSVPRPSPSSGALSADMTVRIPPHDPPMTDRDGAASALEDRHLDSLDVPPVPVSSPAAAALVHDTLPPGPPPASGSDPFPQNDGDSQREPRSFGSIVSSRSSIPRMAFPRKRADELLTVLFEAMYDLAFLRDAVEGADFCVGLALEQIPAARGFLHLYDMDKREFVVVAGRGAAAATRLLTRTADRDARFRAVIRQAGATVDGEAVYAPIVQQGRHIGILELDGALDNQPFGEAEGHALVYIARQYAEFVSQRGVVIDAARVSEMPRSR